MEKIVLSSKKFLHTGYTCITCISRLEQLDLNPTQVFLDINQPIEKLKYIIKNIKAKFKNIIIIGLYKEKPYKALIIFLHHNGILNYKKI